MFSWIWYTINMIKINGVSKIYSTTSVALRDVNLDIKSGEFVSLIGQSGSGKTTLAKLLIAEERPTKGQIQIGDWDITGIGSDEIPFLRRQIGVIFQDFKLLPKKTVSENVAFALEVAGEVSRRIKQVVPELLEIVNLSGRGNRYPYQLSGGEQQRVAIARSLAHRPKLIVADEPTGDLDKNSAREILGLMEGLNQEFGKTIIMVTHDARAAQTARKLIYLDKGVLTRDETT